MTDSRYLSALTALATLLVPGTCLADNLGAIGTALGILVIGTLVIIGAMVLFIVLAVVIRRRVKGGAVRGAMGLSIGARVLVLIWYGVTLTPIVMNLVIAGGHDIGWIVLMTVGAGIPAHIPSVFVLVWAARLAGIARSQLDRPDPGSSQNVP